MKQLRLFLILILSISLDTVIMGCMKQIELKAHEPLQSEFRESIDLSYNKSLEEKLRKYRKIGSIVVQGNLSVQRKEEEMQGSFVMSVSGESVEMYVFSNGIAVGEVILQNGKVKVIPALNLNGKEYTEYMFVVSLRDSVIWWNMHEYEIIHNEAFSVMRNSWKKIYINPDMLVPEKQIIRLMRQREVMITYHDNMDYGFSMLPSKIEIQYGVYKCTLLIEKMEIKEIAMN